MNQFCYLHRDFQIHQKENVNFLIDASGSSLPIYFALKGKHEYEMLGEEKFIYDVKAIVEKFASQFDLVVFPESRYPFLRKITENLTNVVELKKREKVEICEIVKKAEGWKKLDLASAEKSWAEMGESFTINKIKSNKRKAYIPYLFQKMEVAHGKKVLLLDDFIMSGNTIKAMEAALNITEYSTMGIFYQIGYGGKQ
jgi:hypothetical protein